MNLNEQQTGFGADGSSFSDLAIDDTGAIWATDDTTGELTLLRYDNFLVLDQVFFDVGDADQLYGVVLDPNDNVIVCGSTYNPNNDTTNALAIKYDPKAGESVWENIYESSNDQKFLDIQYDLLSDSFYTVGNLESDATMRDGFFMKIDPDGYKVWEHTITVDQDQSLNALGIRGYNLYGVGYNFNNDDHISLPWIDSITEQSQLGVVVVTPGT